jgi:anti-sigma regulatory factor (Ser/Thr protein kinase)
MRKRPLEIRNFLLNQIALGEKSVVSKATEWFGISREAVYKHLRVLIKDGQIVQTGLGRGSRYQLAVLAEAGQTYDLTSGLEEHVLWEEVALPQLRDLAPNELAICNFGFTEMANNAIDHSGGTKLHVRVKKNAIGVNLLVADNGIGIFNKIAAALHLHDPRQSILELSKGKLTTDPDRHTGEGIFFTSRMFDLFSIQSGNLLFFHNDLTEDWLVDIKEYVENGTAVSMALSLPTTRTPVDIFSKFSSGPEEYSFSRTHVPLSLAQFGVDNLVSRSQARRVLLRVDRFNEVLLDFTGVATIGQAFADEIFRVFTKQNPKIEVIAVNTNDQIERMISRARLHDENKSN